MEKCFGIRAVRQKFCSANSFSAKNQQMDLKPKKLYSTGYELLFGIITIPSETFFLSIDEFVDVCSIAWYVHLFDSLLHWDLLLLFICPSNESLYPLVLSWFCDNILHTVHPTHSPFLCEFQYPNNFIVLETK